MNKKLIFTVAIASLLLTACGSTVQGVVRDKPTGNPIPSASVAVDDESTITNNRGVYEISVSTKPSSVISVNAPGYFEYSESLGNSLVHDIELTPRSGQ